MAGQLTIDTLKASSGVLATQNGMTGIAKAWVQFQGGGTTIKSSFNVSSITRSSAGSYAVNFATAMADINYAVATTSLGTTVGPALLSCSAFWVGTTYTAPTTTSFTLGTQSPVNASLIDPTGVVSVIVCGN